MSPTLLANPAKMIARGAPRVIHNDEALEAYTDALFQLTSLENPSRSEREAIELLTLLIERCEETHFRFLPRTQFPSCVCCWSNKASHSGI
jgi:HTH-type transcriptional regulator / antitoxin HigA